MGRGSVYCEVRNEFLNTIHMYVKTNKGRVWLKQPPTTKVQVQSRPSTCENSGGRTGNCKGSSPSTSVFSCSTIPPLLYSYLRVVVLFTQWPRGLRRRSAAACLLRLWVRIPPGAWLSVCSECRVLSDRGLCDGLITRPEESYRLWCVVVCDLETSCMRRPGPVGAVAPKEE